MLCVIEIVWETGKQDVLQVNMTNEEQKNSERLRKRVCHSKHLFSFS